MTVPARAPTCWGRGVKEPGGRQNNSYPGSCQGQAASCLRRRAASPRATLASVSGSIQALTGLPSDGSQATHDGRGIPIPGRQKVMQRH